jgi:quercetin dioxygenase-like cupin family protein
VTGPGDDTGAADDLPARAPEAADLLGLAGAGDGVEAGVRWHLRGDGDLNANLVSFPEGEGVGEHVNDALDVLIVGMGGEGDLVVDGVAHALTLGSVVLVPRGSRRGTRARSERFSYLTVHRRRTPGISLGP